MDNTSFAPGNNSINNSVPSSIPQYSTPEHKHFLNKKFAIAIIILLLLGAGAYAGIWYWGNQQQSGVYTFEECVKAKDSKMLETYPEQCVTNDGQTFVNPNQTAPEPSTTGSIPADWKTYTNTQYGFEIKYPADKYLVNPSDTVDYENTILQSKFDMNNSTVYFKIQIEAQPFETVRQGLKKVSGGSEPIESSVTFAGVNGYAYVEKYPEPTAVISMYEILIQRNGIVYYILTQKYNLQEIKQILSTFKFTESNSGGQTMCTQEAKQCPDGSYVSRTGPNCAFAICPK